MVYRFDLSPSPSGKPRRYTFVPVRSSEADGYLTLSVGSVGPKGGTSGLKVGGYFVQQQQQDPAFARAALSFLLVRDVPGGSVGAFEFDREDRSAEPLVVWLSLPYPGGSCSCDGFRGSLDCKHLAALAHLVRVAGWRADRA